MIYAAYGSNTNLEQMEHRCPNSFLIGTGKIKGWRLYFNVHADIMEGSKGDFVPCAIWNISKTDIDNLDRYEGTPRYYITKHLPVEMDSGEMVDALVYVMSKNVKGIYPPYKPYFEGCEIGYIENGLDTNILYEALDYTLKNKTTHNQYS